MLFDDLANLAPACLCGGLLFALAVEFGVARCLCRRGSLLLGSLGRGFLLAVALAQVLVALVRLPLLLAFGLTSLLFGDQAGLQQLLAQRQATHRNLGHRDNRADMLLSEPAQCAGKSAGLSTFGRRTILTEASIAPPQGRPRICAEAACDPWVDTQTVRI